MIVIILSMKCPVYLEKTGLVEPECSRSHFLLLNPRNKASKHGSLINSPLPLLFIINIGDDLWMLGLKLISLSTFSTYFVLSINF